MEYTVTVSQIVPHCQDLLYVSGKHIAHAQRGFFRFGIVINVHVIWFISRCRNYYRRGKIVIILNRTMCAP